MKKVKKKLIVAGSALAGILAIALIAMFRRRACRCVGY